MSDNGDNVKPLKNGNQKVDLVGNATSALEKARKESYEAKVKAKVQVLQEQKKAIRITEKEIEELVNDFESGF